MNRPNVRKSFLDSIAKVWNNQEYRRQASINASKRNASPEFKEKFRKSKSRGTWIHHEEELKSLWIALGKPGYIRFRNNAIEHGFNDESYQGAIRSWTNYYANRKSK